jgi:hypothetical protein
MTSAWVAHLLSLAYGLSAALISLAAFYVVGLLLLPRRWHSSMRWPDCVVLGMTVYVLLCWVATSSRNIPLIYVMLVFGAALWVLVSVRFRWLRDTLEASPKNPATQEWVAGFGILYVLAYILVRTPAGAALLALPPDGALDLVTYARYAKHLMAYGTAHVDLAPFGYLHSPASAYLLAWHSLLFLGDPLNAAMPLLLMMAALFGTITVELARSVFGLFWRAAMAIAAIAVCAPAFRWALATYSLGELLSATSVLYLAGVSSRAAATRLVDGSLLLRITAGGTLLFFSAWSAAGSLGTIARGVFDVARHVSPLALLGLPSGTPLAAKAPEFLSSAALVVLPLVPLVWAAAAWALRRSSALERVDMSTVDRRLASAVVVYVAVGVIVGNVAVQAVRGPRPLNRPGAWRDLSQVDRMPFRAMTLKVADEPSGLSTALAMYYMPGRKANVIGRGVSLDDLPFEDVSRQQPMFIQNFGCEGVGHGDTVFAPGVGCLLMAPPSMTVGTSYPFNRTFLFLSFDRMTPRDPGGRWNTRSNLNLQMTADPQRVRLDRAMYMNFLVDPFLPPEVKPQRLVLRWGTDRRAEISVAGRQWFSLPVASNDWSGDRLWVLPVTIDFPDRRAMLFREVALTETPRGQVAVPMVSASPKR